MPGDHAAPEGMLISAMANGEVAGCCALRRLPTADRVNTAEMKRRYVRRANWRTGLNRTLVASLLDMARVAGYHSVLWDTLDDMASACVLYQELGLVDIPPDHHNRMPSGHYL